MELILDKSSSYDILGSYTILEEKVDADVSH